MISYFSDAQTVGVIVQIQKENFQVGFYLLRYRTYLLFGLGAVSVLLSNRSYLTESTGRLIFDLQNRSK